MRPQACAAQNLQVVRHNPRHAVPEPQAVWTPALRQHEAQLASPKLANTEASVTEFVTPVRRLCQNDNLSMEIT